MDRNPPRTAKNLDGLILVQPRWSGITDEKVSYSGVVGTPINNQLKF